MDNLINLIKEEKLISILRNVPLVHLDKVLDILKEEGIRLLEITLNSKDVNAQFDLLNSKYKSDFVIGAGTVLNKNDAEFALKKGVSFFLTPNVCTEVLEFAEKNNILCICGFFTLSEALCALKYSCCKILKLFPAGDMPYSYLKSLQGPVEDLECIAVGGVNKDNYADFLKAGYCGAGIGSALINNKLVAEGKFELVRENVKSIKSISDRFLK